MALVAVIVPQQFDRLNGTPERPCWTNTEVNTVRSVRGKNIACKQCAILSVHEPDFHAETKPGGNCSLRFSHPGRLDG